MLKIDSHQHFWKFDPVRDSWITDEMSVIQHDFLPGDLQPLLLQNGFHGCVAVQSDQSEEHNTFLLDLAKENDFIKGVVGWVDLQKEDIEERLNCFSQFKKLKGFRHVLQGETDRTLMLRPGFMNGISKLRQFNFTYDILIFPDQLQYVPDFVSAFPDQKFVIDHIAKPLIKAGEIEAWKKEIETVANYENVYCKVSGMVTEADWKNWKQPDFTPYLDAVVNSFGTKKIMYGSDWPVCLVAGSYNQQVAIVKEYLSRFSENEQGDFYGGNAVRFYSL